MLSFGKRRWRLQIVWSEMTCSLVIEASQKADGILLG
jgi:hypothetical protein